MKNLNKHIRLPQHVDEWYKRFAKSQSIPVSQNAAIVHVLEYFMRQEEKEFTNNHK